jgi:hypothetical protein
MRNGFTAGFCHFLGTNKNLDKKNIFCVKKICKFFEEKKKTKKLFLCGKNRLP